MQGRQQYSERGAGRVRREWWHALLRLRCAALHVHNQLIKARPLPIIILAQGVGSFSLDLWPLFGARGYCRCGREALPVRASIAGRNFVAC